MSLFPTEKDEFESKIFILESENEMLRNSILELRKELIKKFLTSLKYYKKYDYWFIHGKDYRELKSKI